MKWCPKCRNHKEEHDFHKASREADGLRPWCKECTRASMKASYHKDINASRERYRMYRAIPENAERSRENARRYRNNDANKPTLLNSKLKHKYNITIEQFNELKQLQNFKCAICGKPETDIDGKLNVDHCHVNGNVRALLCSNCNKGLGCFKDDIELMSSAIRYLQRYQRKENA